MKQLIKVPLLLALLFTGSYFNQAFAEIVCPPGGKYMTEREQAVEAYRTRHNADLYQILIDNPPDLDNIYEGCVGRLIDIYKAARQLIYGKTGLYTASGAIIAILEGEARRLIDRQCRKVVQEAQESYGDIADVIPAGDYWIDFDQIAGTAVGG